YALALNQMRWIESNLFDERLWSEKRSDAFRYVELSVKILYLNALHDEAYALVNVLSVKAKNIQERLKCFTLLKNICVTQGKNFPALVEFGNRLLQELGVRAPVLAAEVNERTQTLKEKLIHHPLFDNPDGIMELPLLKNSKQHRIASLLVDYWEAAYYLADIPLMQWAYLNIVDSSFRYGNSSESTFGYVLFGAQLIGEKNYKKGYAFGEVALKLNGVLRDEIMLPKVHNFVANFINPYVKPLYSNVMLYQKSLQQSKINGDIVFGTWANFLMHFSEYLSGSSLEVLRRKIGDESTFILNSGDEKMISIFNILVHTVHALQEKSEDKSNEEERAIAMWEKDKFYPALAWYGVLKAQNCLIEGAYEEGIRYFERYVHSTANEVIMFPKIRLHFIRALLLLGKETALSEQEDALLRLDLSECEEIMKASPANFKFGRLLLRAEQMKLLKKSWETAKIYDAALEEARKKSDPFFAALGALCASRFWKRIQYEELSRIYLNEAIVSLNQWGAYEAANRLKGVAVPVQSIRLENSSSHSSSIRVEPENFKSLLNSFYAISRAMDQTELINTLMQTILENATASRAILVLLEGGTFSTKARLDFKGGKIEFDTISLNESPRIPQNIVQYAINTGKKVLVTNPAQSGQFQFDEYIKAYKPASCIAIPTSVDGNVLGVLYLENEEIATPLSPESVQTLELLLTQAAIIFRSTALYETLKISEENLNKAQKISHVGSWQYNSATSSIVWSAETYRIYDVEPFSIQIDNDWFFDHLHPQDVHRVLDAVEKALSAQKPYDIVHRILTVKGQEKIVHQRAEVFWEADQQKMSGTIQDITDSAHAEAMISRLNQVVYQNPFSTIITDKYGVIEYVNAQCVKMTGYFEHELLGQKMNIFGSGLHSKAFYAQLWKTIAVDRKMWRGTIVNRMKNNELCDCSSTIFPLFNTNNEITNFVTVQEDITEKNIKDKLFLMQTRQAQMGEMLSMIAHQWRQPLAIISALMNKQRVDIMLEKSTMSDVAQSYEDIEFQVQHLSRTISDFRDFFKPDKEMTRTKSSTIVTKAAALIGHTLKQKNIALDMTHAYDDEYLTFEHEMIQVLLNLIKNAQDAIEEQGIGHAWIKITTDQADDTAVITVEDNAGGIDTNVIDTLFLPYVSTKNEQNGTGLGLYMSKTIIEEHCSGSIAVENTENGAKFTIKIAMKAPHGNI
ncbi:MAG TPA: ATP-binding protein, partial [Sulfuricurvum sp.]|nr:ATP-binding protein [Sulfuricurvum sp.]